MLLMEYSSIFMSFFQKYMADVIDGLPVVTCVSEYTNHKIVEIGASASYSHIYHRDWETFHISSRPSFQAIER